MLEPNKLVLTENILNYPYKTIKTYFTYKENIYFLILGLIQFSCGIILPKSWSPTGQYSTLVPLLICVLVEVLISFMNYYKNKKIEDIENNKLFTVYNKDLIKKYTKSKYLNTGDILICDKNTVLPIDGILLYPNVCEISTILINGESVPHYIKSIYDFKDLDLDNLVLDLDNLDNLDLDNLNTDCIINGSIIKQKSLIYVKNVGKNKINNIFNDNNIYNKSTIITDNISKCINTINIKLLICIIIFFSLINNNNNLISNIIQTWILFNNIIPFSVKLILVFVRTLQTKYLNNLNKFKINNSSIIDDVCRIKNIISDKTGTITKGKLSLQNIFLLENNVKVLTKESFINSYQDYILYDCISKCVNVSNDDFCTDEDKIIYENFQNEGIYNQIKLDGLNFTFIRKRSSTIYKRQSDYILYTKGSIDSIKSIANNNYEINEIMKNIDTNYPHLRLIAYGYKILPNLDIKDYEQDITFVGIVGFVDELQDNVKETIQKLKNYNIKCNLCTGDRQLTSIVIAKKANIIDQDFEIVHGLDNMISYSTKVFDSNTLNLYKNNKIFIERLRKCKNFVAYNMLPNDKAILAEILNVNDALLAIGDGHNDLGMFNKSHISIAIKSCNIVNNNSDIVINKFDDLLNVLHTSYNAFIKNSWLNDFTFYRCMMTNFCNITFILLQPLQNILFDGFTLLAFNFLWTIMPIIYYSVLNLDSDYINKINCNLKTKLWLFLGALHGIICVYMMFNYMTEFIVLMIILQLNLIYVIKAYKQDYILYSLMFVGPLLYIMYIIIQYLV
ncbi:magnesium-transporting ATPase [Hokovirus HKV1]|uniref:Magnesium-transporting ATPase n=1 Tax=Hokovirus HKV1 TaxID=1977638 RepID=A0A1V0SFN6_9VIRU|nr:magnesium-transporting ATPase [Hokovirus HKV1]